MSKTIFKKPFNEQEVPLEVLCNELLKEKPDKKKIKGLMYTEGLKFENDSLLQLSTVLDRLDKANDKEKPLTNIQAKSKKKSTNKSNPKLKVKPNETSL